MHILPNAYTMSHLLMTVAYETLLYSVILCLQATQCSLYPEDHDPLGVEPRWLFADMTREEKNKVKTFQARFVHIKVCVY